MSNLSLSVDELSRLEVTIRLEQSVESLSFGMQSRAPTSEVPPLSLAGSCSVNFQICEDTQGPILRVFASTTDVGQPDKLTDEKARVGSIQNDALASTSQGSDSSMHGMRANFPPFVPRDGPVNVDILDPRISPWTFDGINPLQSESSLYPLFDAPSDGGLPSNNDNNYEPWLPDSPESVLDYGDDGSMSHSPVESGVVIPNDFGYYFDFAPSSCMQHNLDLPELSSSSSSSASSSLPSPTLSSPTFPHRSSSAFSSSSRMSSCLSATTAGASVWSPPTPPTSAKRIGCSQGTTSDNEGDQRRRFSCLIPGCTRRFTSQYTLKVHMDAHKPKPRTSFPCTLGCSETFSRQHDRLRHEVAKHGKVCDWLCHDCGRFFSSKKTLGNHKCPNAPGGTRWVTETALAAC